MSSRAQTAILPLLASLAACSCKLVSSSSGISEDPSPSDSPQQAMACLSREQRIIFAELQTNAPSPTYPSCATNDLRREFFQQWYGAGYAYVLVANHEQQTFVPIRRPADSQRTDLFDAWYSGVSLGHLAKKQASIKKADNALMQRLTATNTAQAMEAMAGKKAHELIAAFGLPDQFCPPYNFGTIFLNKPPTAVVLTYTTVNRYVYLDEQGTILGVLPPKTFPRSRPKDD